MILNKEKYLWLKNGCLIFEDNNKKTKKCHDLAKDQ